MLSGNSSMTLVHKGQRGVTVASNFGSKIAINAYKRISTRGNETAITYNRGFSWSTNPKKTFMMAWEPNFGENRPKIREMAITSVVCNTSMHSLVVFG